MWVKDSCLGVFLRQFLRLEIETEATFDSRGKEKLTNNNLNQEFKDWNWRFDQGTYTANLKPQAPVTSKGVWSCKPLQRSTQWPLSSHDKRPNYLILQSKGKLVLYFRMKISHVHWRQPVKPTLSSPKWHFHTKLIISLVCSQHNRWTTACEMNWTYEPNK